MAARILVVDDESEIREVLTEVLEAAGFEVIAAGDGAAALEEARARQPSVILLDLTMPRMGGMAALPEIKRFAPETPVIICTAHTDIHTAVQAMRLGAYDYLTKPFDMDILMLAVKRALEREELRAHISELKSQGEGASLVERMGSSPQIRAVIQQAAQVARSNYTVLVQGETGTGKELIARSIHAQSERRGKPFVAVDCGAIPETLVESELFGYEKGAFTGAQRRKDGQFQLAHGGTLFLDEIGNVPVATQAKLLRALEERQVTPLGGTRPVAVDVRIIAATNLNFEEEVRGGRFRADLFYRLNEFALSLPPLRDRREDIAHLAHRFLAEACMELRRPVRGISDEAMQVLMRHEWPGNVRELKNVIRKAALLASDVITPEFLPAFEAAAASARSTAVAPPAGDDLSLREVAELAAADAERRSHAKMKRYGIGARDFKES